MCLILQRDRRLNGSPDSIGKVLETRPLPMADLPLGGCEMQLAWGFQSKGEVALLVGMGKGSMRREPAPAATQCSQCLWLPGSSSLCVFVETLSSPLPDILLTSSMRLSISLH